jgi:hypothetical protein
VDSDWVLWGKANRNREYLEASVSRWGHRSHHRETPGRLQWEIDHFPRNRSSRNESIPGRNHTGCKSIDSHNLWDQLSCHWSGNSGCLESPLSLAQQEEHWWKRYLPQLHNAFGTYDWRNYLHLLLLHYQVGNLPTQAHVTLE